MTTITTGTTTTTSSQSGGLTLRVERRGRTHGDQRGRRPRPVRRTVGARAAGLGEGHPRSDRGGPTRRRRGDHRGARRRRAKLELTTNAATLAYPAASPAHHDLRAWVGQGARFAWSPGSLILAAGCDLDTSVDIETRRRRGRVQPRGRRTRPSRREPRALPVAPPGRGGWTPTPPRRDRPRCPGAGPALTGDSRRCERLRVTRCRRCRSARLMRPRRARPSRARSCAPGTRADTASLQARIASVEAFYRASLDLPSATRRCERHMRDSNMG